MIQPDRFKEIFSDDSWRDPTSDVERLACYILLAVGWIVSVSSLGYFGFLLLSPPDRPEEIAVMCIAAPVLLLSIFYTPYFFAKERKHWNLKAINAERVFAGIFSFWAALVMISFWFLSEAGGLLIAVYLLPISIGGIILTLLCGLPFAYAPKWFPKVLSFERVYVLRRFAVDIKAMEHEDYVAPFENGLRGYLTLRQSNGSCKTFRATPSSYELSRPDSMIRAKVVNGILIESKQISVSRKVSQFK